MAEFYFDSTTDPTLEAVDRAIEGRQEKQLRPYLGMSQLGDACARKLWYSFRMAKLNSHNAATIKRFEDGHHGEDLQAARLRMVDGIELHTHDESGNQFGFKLFGGHLSGHMDGAIKGLLQAPKTWHVWEHKQVGEDKFMSLIKLKHQHGEKNALRQWDQVYYGQALLYMEFSGMTRHYLTCSTPGGRSTVSVRTEENKTYVKQLIDRAEKIIFGGLPEKLSKDPAFYHCKFCSFADICHGTQMPLPNCRSCVHASAELNGCWSCDWHNLKELTLPVQVEGCNAHRYIPPLLNNFADTVDGNETANVATYLNRLNGHHFANAEGSANDYSSQEIYHADDKRALGDPGVEEFKEEFEAVIA